MCDDIVDAVQKQQSENDLSAIVPFGKYKGQPVTVLSGDPAYCEWLQGQDGIRKKYPSIINLIVNNFSVPQDTPEHNALQAVFVDNEEFIKKLVTVLCNLKGVKAPDCWRAECRNKQGKIGSCSWVGYTYSNHYPIYYRDLDAECWRNIKKSEFYAQQLKPIEDNYLKFVDIWCNTEFEREGWDVVLTVSIKFKESEIDLRDEKALCFCKNASSILDKSADLHISLSYGDKDFKGNEFALEIKPQIGDDYPAVMREIRARKLTCGWPVLLYQTFTGKGVTEAQMRKMLGTCAKVFRFDEIDKIKPVDFNFTFSHNYIA